MKIKTSELNGKALDWVVAVAKGVPPSDIRIAYDRIYRRRRDEEGNLTNSYLTGPEFLFHKLWEAAGPIIEREQLTVEPIFWGSVEKLIHWQAYGHNLKYDEQGSCVEGSDNRQSGPTPLIAAMRCYISSKLGPEVEVPDELL